MTMPRRGRKVLFFCPLLPFFSLLLFTTSATGLLPTSWCDNTGSRPCLSPSERSALAQLEANRPGGIQPLRDASCFPRNVSIVVAGIYRSGSTLLYNIVRLWTAFGQGAGTGGMAAGRKCTPDMHEYAGSRVTVCKDHMLHDRVAKSVDVVLMSRRAPAQSVCSRKLEGQWCRWPEKLGRTKLKWNTPEWNAFIQHCLTDKELSYAEVGRQCRELMRLQADVYHGRHTVGRGIAFDSLLSDFTEDPARQIGRIGQAMGICSQATTDVKILTVLVSLAKNLQTDTAGASEITFMHGTHTNLTERAEKCGFIKAAVYAETECAKWARHDAAYSSNAVLRRMADLKLNSWSAASYTPLQFNRTKF